jgi:hypothetical protein
LEEKKRASPIGKPWQERKEFRDRNTEVTEAERFRENGEMKI